MSLSSAFGGACQLMTNAGNSHRNVQISHADNVRIDNGTVLEAALMTRIMDDYPRKMVIAFRLGGMNSECTYAFKNNIMLTSVGPRVSVPTAIFFDPQQHFHGFGAEAEEEYARMSEENAEEARKWYYFDGAKMTLRANQYLTYDMELWDQTQEKSMPAVDVFSGAISYLMTLFHETRSGVRDEEITYVLPFPAFWDDRKKQMLKKAAEKAGIPREQLLLIPEHEAASVYCQAFPKALQIPIDHVVDGFLVVHCGGQTTDISVLETKATKNLRHLHRPAGTADGGVSVDNAFQDFLGDLVGIDGVASFGTMEMLQLRRNLEQTKRAFKAYDEEAHIEIQPTVARTLSASIASSEKYSKRVNITKNRLSLDGDLFLSFYNQATASITAAIRDALATNKANAIFLVGGFSESDVIQNAVQRAFPEVQVVTAQSVSQSVEGCPPFSGVGAVLMGAVMYGHDPKVIATRVSAYTN